MMPGPSTSRAPTGLGGRPLPGHVLACAEGKILPDPQKLCLDALFLHLIFPKAAAATSSREQGRPGRAWQRSRAKQDKAARGGEGGSPPFPAAPAEGGHATARDLPNVSYDARRANWPPET